MLRGARSPMTLSSCRRWRTRSTPSRTVSGLSGRFSPMLSPIYGTCLSRPHQTKSRRLSGPSEVTQCARSPDPRITQRDGRQAWARRAAAPVLRPGDLYGTHWVPTRRSVGLVAGRRQVHWLIASWRPSAGPRPPRVSRHPAVPEPVLKPRRHPGVPSGLPLTRRRDPRPTSPPRATGHATCTTDEDASAMAIEEDPVGGMSG
jgi:hypothetical protein